MRRLVWIVAIASCKQPERSPPASEVRTPPPALRASSPADAPVPIAASPDSALVVASPDAALLATSPDAALTAAPTAFDAGCAVIEGRLSCWGYNYFRQIGSEVNDKCGLPCARTPCFIEGLQGVRAVASGGTTCALDSRGRVWCWGDGSSGMLGKAPPESCGDRNNAWNCTAEPTLIEGLPKVRAISVNTHACALTADGEVYCWGAGHLGFASKDKCEGNLEIHPSQTNPDGGAVPCARTPQRVPGVRDIVQISAGRGQTCALTRGGTVLCWGDNSFGEAGVDPKVTFVDTPTTVAGVDRAIAISAGTQVSCAVRRGGDVWCWGSDEQGQLGANETTEPCGKGLFSCRHTAQPVKGLNNVVEVGVGFTHSCARRRDGTVACWGIDRDSELGFHAHEQCGRVKQACARTPQTVPSISGATALAVSDQSSCVVMNGQLRCWGANNLGQLGDGSGQEQLEPRVVAKPRRCK